MHVPTVIRPASNPADKPTTKEPSVRIGRSHYHDHDHDHPFVDEKCALLFFGVPRCFPEAHKSIKKHTLSINPKCDIYLHTYNISILPGNPRNNERETEVNINQVYQLTNNVTMDTMEYFHKRRNVSYYRQYFPKAGGWKYLISMDNMIKQWHSLQSVWNYMDSKLINYTRVGLFRIDLMYLNPINISQGIAVKGDFNLDISKEAVERSCNDRLFYGLYNYSKVWATERFPFVPAYLRSAAMHRYRIGLHSETFLYYLITTKIPVDVETKHICAKRVRNGCKTDHKDCVRFKP